MTMKEDIQKVKTELEEIKEKERKQPSFAMEILHDFKVQNKRLFVEGIAILVLIIGLIVK